MSKIWIDLDNSPHIPLFAPIIRELATRGHEVVVTARDAFQVKDLADLHQLQYKLIGRHYGKHLLLKLLGLGVRAAQLLPTAVRARPVLSVSHGSRSQLAASVLWGIPSLMIADYEHSKTWAVVRPTWVMVPEVIPSESIHAPHDRILRYPGIKEDVYVPRFKPDLTVRERLNLKPSEIVVTIRPPATEAHYRNPKGENLFREVVNHLASTPETRMIVLPRNQAQAEMVREIWPALTASSKIVIPSQVEDGLNLIWNSDFVISGGGTMNREAAALRVPVYTIFLGAMGAVDRFLASENRLVVIKDSSDVRSKILVASRQRNEVPAIEANATMKTIVDHIERLLTVHAAPRQATGAL